jgi:HPt (histidine-containing phosphotransfer) domain-containing protein
MKEAPLSDSSSNQPTDMMKRFAGRPEMLQMQQHYVADLPKSVEQLQANLAAGQLDEVKTTAHRIRGVAASFGFAALGQLAAIVDDAAQEGRDPSESAQQLCQLIEKTVAEYAKSSSDPSEEGGTS